MSMRSTVAFCVLVAVAAIGMGQVETSPAADKRPAVVESKSTAVVSDSSPAEQKIFAELNRTIQPMKFEHNTLADLAKFISKNHRINVVIEERSLEDEGLSSEDIEINADLSGIPLRSALRTILDPHALTWVIRNDSMYLTTEVYAESEFSTQL